MLAQNGNGPTDFENGDEDGWPVGTQTGEQSGEKMNDDTGEENKYHTYHAMGKVTNNDIN